MAIVLPQGRPALDVTDGTYERPEEPWARLGDPGPRQRLEPAIAAVGRLSFSSGPDVGLWGTVFAVGPDLLMSCTAGPGGGSSAVVDFGHGAAPGESMRVEVEELVYLDPRWHVVLYRAELPAAIEPLRLAAQQPAGLAGRDVVLLGYPSSGASNDPGLMRQIFRGALDVKRLLPGRIREQAEHSYWGFDVPVLVHDCSSSPGCGGAPLVDVETGEVLGVHFAGMPLMWNHAVPAWELARDERFASEGVRFAGQLPASVAPRADAGQGTRAADPVVEAPATAAGPGPAAPSIAAAGTVAPAYADDALEGDRPALLARRWEADLSAPWTAVLEPRKSRLDVVVRAVGKVLNGIGGEAWSGTAFLVGERLALTASFVAEAFADGAGLQTAMHAGQAAAVDFSDSLGQPPGSATAAVTGVRFIHPYFHVALLELAELPQGVAALELAAQLPSQLSGRLLALVSFAGDADGLLIQPGQALQMGEIPGATRLPALVHDCTSGMGSAGGPLIDLGTGYVVGVHTHGKGTEGGFAQPTWELARDPYVWRHPIGFRPDPRPSWLADWDADDAQPPLHVDAQPSPGNGRWTVDEVPIKWARAEPQALEQLLIDTIDAQMAIWWAESVGLQLDTVNTVAPPKLLWRQILKVAATAGLLRLLLERIAASRDYAGIEPKLRAYL
jgi:Trypsin-like peptidase domain